MENSKLIKVLSKLTKRELGHFHEYAACSFSGLKPASLLLLDHLVSKHPNYDSAELSKEALFKVIFPHLPFRKQRILAISSDAYLCLKDFLAFKDWRQNSIDRQLGFLRQARVKKLKNIHEISSTAVKKELAKEAFGTDHSLLQAYQFQEELMNQYISLDSRTEDLKLQSIGDALDQFYIARKLKLGVEMLTMQKLLGIDFQQPLLGEVQAHVESNPSQFQDLLSVQIHALELRCLQNESNPKAYQDLLSILEENVEAQDSARLRMHYRFAQNYCIRKINTGNDAYIQELFNIYTKLIETALILEQGMIAPSDYKNIISVSLRLGKKQWAFDFIHSHKDMLPESDKENNFRLNLANYYYEIGRHTDAVELLQDMEFKDIFADIQARYLQIKVAYDSNSSQHLEWLLLAFTRFIGRQKTLGTQRKNSLSNFSKALKRIMKLKQKALTLDKKALESNKQQVAEYVSKLQPINNGQWLTKKIEEIK